MSLATRLNEAVSRHQAGDLAAAEAAYRAIIAETPDQPDALNLLAVLCGQTQREAEAVPLFERATGLAPAVANFRYNLATVLRSLGGTDEAIAAFRHTVELEPTHARAWHNLGVCLHETNQLAEALDAHERALAIDGDYALAHRSRGEVLRDLGRGDDAVDAFAALVALDPTSADAHAGLASALTDAGRFDEALPPAKTAARLEPRRAVHRHEAGFLLQQLGHLDAAVAQYERALAAETDFFPTLCNLCGLHRLQGDVDRAIACGERAVAVKPASTDARNALARAYLDARRIAEAIAQCEAAIATDPDHVPAHLSFARALTQRSEPEMAIEYLQSVIERIPDSAELHHAIASMLRAAGDLDGSDTAYRTAIAHGPDHLPARLGHLRLRIGRGEHQAVLDELEPLAARHPNSLELAWVAAQAHLGLGAPETALDELEPHAMRTQLPRADERLLRFEMGRINDRLGRYPEAFRNYTRANELAEGTFSIDAFAETVDRIIATFSAEALQSFPRATRSSDAPVFITGMPRSGTTLVEQIVCSHEQAAAIGEADLLLRTIVRSGELADTSVGYPACVEDLDQGGVDALSRWALETMRKKAPDAARITEKTTTSVVRLGLVPLLFPGARVINTVRNPLDTCLSCFFHDFRGHHDYAYDLANLGAYYRLQERLMDHWRTVLDIPIMTLRYEDLVADQEGVTRTLLEFCELPYDERCLRFHENDRYAPTASAEQVQQPIFTSSVRRHEHYAAFLGPLHAALAANDPAACAAA